MKDPNEKRRGYKKTNVGWIPEGWQVKPLSSTAHLVRGPFGGALKKEIFVTSGYRVYEQKHAIRKDFTAGSYFIDEAKYQEMQRFAVKPGDFIMSCSGTAGRFALVPNDAPAGIINQALLKITPAKSKVDTHYLKFFFHGHLFQAHLFSDLAGGAIKNVAGIPVIKEIPILIPPLPEQQKIAEILSTWDDAIEQTATLIESKRQQKKALMQQLLTGHRRLPGFEGNWGSKKLAVLVERINETAEDPEKYPVLSITAGKGFESQADKFSRVIAGKHIENYVLLRRGEFAYNKGNSYRYPQGCVYQLHEYDEGLVPSVFYSFRAKPEKIHDAFLKHYFIAGLHNPQLYRWINTGVRNNGLLNLNAADFFNIQIGLPALEEQRAIAAVLDAADKEIASLEAKLEALRQQKKGLMQRLLTGQVRVKV